MPTNDPRPTKAVRRDEARAKAAQMRKEQERKAKRNRLLAIAASSSPSSRSSLSSSRSSTRTRPTRPPTRTSPTARAPRTSSRPRSTTSPRRPPRTTRAASPSAVRAPTGRRPRRRRHRPHHLLRLHVPLLRPVRRDQRRRPRRDAGGGRRDDHVPPGLDPRPPLRGQLLLDAGRQRDGDRRRQVAGALHRRSSTRCTRTSRPRAPRVAPTPRSPRSPRTWASPPTSTRPFTDTVDGTFDTAGRGVRRGHLADVRPVERRGDQPGGPDLPEFSTPTVLINGEPFKGGRRPAR